MPRRMRCGLIAVVLGLAACGNGGDEATAPDPADGVRIASADFAENVLLAEMYAQVIESTGVPVVRLGAIGPREIIAPAMELGHIDLVPEYLGSALQHAGATEPESDTDLALAELNARLVRRELRALAAAPAQNRNVFAVTAEVADQYGIEDVSHLAPLASQMSFGGLPECPDRPLCLAGLETVYGLTFAEFVPQRDLRFTAEALRRAEIDVGLMFSTASELVAFDLFVLDDDRQMQPAENIVPIARIDALGRWGPALARQLNSLSAQLTTRELRILNVRVDSEETVDAVAREWLVGRGLIGAD